MNMYKDALAEGLGDELMPQPGDAFVVGLVNAGYDVWLDGNRGTLY